MTPGEVHAAARLADTVAGFLAAFTRAQPNALGDAPELTDLIRKRLAEDVDPAELVEALTAVAAAGRPGAPVPPAVAEFADRVWRTAEAS